MEKKEKKEKKKDKKTKCEAWTREGAQCSRDHTKVLRVKEVVTREKKLCTQHYNSEVRKKKQKKKDKKDRLAVSVVGDPEPWTLLRFMNTPREENGGRVLQKLRTLLKKGPRKNRPLNGYIYLYYLQRDHQAGVCNYWKIGMTTRDDYEKRVAEWTATHAKDAGVTHRRTYATRHPEFAERIIHLYLHYCRMMRYPRTDARDRAWLHSVWYHNNAVIEDGQQRKDEEGEDKLVAKNKHTEWFCEDLNYIHIVVRDVCGALGVWERRYNNVKSAFTH